MASWPAALRALDYSGTGASGGPTFPLYILLLFGGARI